ncbi:hypothetical protein HOY34_04595 [Xinfangfangia sp. D13-10-4-6]|uniref:helix-turn-helix domain-containing protein n=1 Tax=Pseudogemmobacter hezensis TaxID=2737662 RepID=UPI001555CBE1|nr:helix-turn-helix domain-containing protein [Pseudogemmobacter hezensis]NPD14478.1 hypothetical protein [Pseudogemmobacter hezensis]
MSHAATNWAIRQRGLKPAAKIVLWHLADRHNGDTGQCNPKQERLAQDCEMSRSTLNLHLNELERLGLIRRIVTIDGATKRQRPTAYVLIGFEREAESDNRTRTASGNRTRKPCPKKPESRVRNSDTKNPVKEPGKHARETGAPKRSMHPIPVSGSGAENWSAWLKRSDHPPIDELAERAEHAGEPVWLLPIRSPPRAGDRIEEGIVLRWIEERRKAR